VLETFIECGQTFIPKIPPVTAPTGMEVSLLVWSRGLLEEYLSAREKEGLSANTISHHKSAGISFLLYLQSQGLTSILLRPKYSVIELPALPVQKQPNIMTTGNC
jgi:hypothetical protein